MTTKKVLVYGGSFNPPHMGHVITAFYASCMVQPDFTLVIPTFQHPDGKGLADFESRFWMCKLAMNGIPNLKVSSIEEEMGGVSYTLRTVQRLLWRNPDWRITLLMGADVARNFSTWSDYSQLSKLVDVFQVGRMGFISDELEKIVPEVSSSRIRSSIQGGQWEDVVELLHPEVLDYIKAYRLYGYPAQGEGE